ncbi:hypothetical protein [Croceiramulus getboli]|nr:hypothetical protein P8624_03485 [Flavobacteriaceae bacterium YJPT1-3]
MKIIKTLFALVFMSVAFLACEQAKPHEEEHMEKPVDPPTQIIPVEDAEILAQDYRRNRIPLIEEFQNRDDNGEPIDPEDPEYVRATQALTVDFETLKTYITYIEQQADSAKINISGLRIYLGKYPNAGKFPDGRPVKYPNAETVFLNPVAPFENAQGQMSESGFAIVTNPDGTKKAVPVGQLLNKNMKGNGPPYVLMFQDDVTDLSFNDMNKIPPPQQNDNDF